VYGIRGKITSMTPYVAGNVGLGGVPIPETTGNAETGTKRLRNVAKCTVRRFLKWKRCTVRLVAFPKHFNMYGHVSLLINMVPWYGNVKIKVKVVILYFFPFLSFYLNL